jgi:hypothetical protein
MRDRRDLGQTFGFSDIMARGANRLGTTWPPGHLNVCSLSTTVKEGRR